MLIPSREIGPASNDCKQVISFLQVQTTVATQSNVLLLVPPFTPIGLALSRSPYPLSFGATYCGLLVVLRVPEFFLNRLHSNRFLLSGPNFLLDHHIHPSASSRPMWTEKSSFFFLSRSCRSCYILAALNYDFQHSSQSLFTVLSTHIVYI